MSTIASASQLGTVATVRRGFQISPEISRGLWVTLLLAIGASVGRTVVPITVQQIIDDGILGAGGPDFGVALRQAGVALAVLLGAAICSSAMNFRLIARTEAGLATLRIRAFRHIHELSVLTQNTESRGALVSRVTSDVDTISQFMQWGGIMLVVSALQLLVSSILMLTFSVRLTLVVWACFIPLFLIFRLTSPRVRAAYLTVRQQTGLLLGAISETVVGAETVRAYGVGARALRRIDRAIEHSRQSQGRAQMLVASTFTAGNLCSNLTLAAVVVVGTRIGMAGGMSAGQVVAFLFLVQLFTGPVQLATEILNELQSALAGWRRVIAIVETPIDIGEPAKPTNWPAAGKGEIYFDQVWYAYPQADPELTKDEEHPDGVEAVVVEEHPNTATKDGVKNGANDVRYALADVNLLLPARKRIAIVGQTGGGKTTLAKLACRLLDPTEGRVLLDGIDLKDLSLKELREHIILVPQEGFLFEGTIADNVKYGARSKLSNSEVETIFVNLGLGDWIAELPNGMETDVGQRGDSLSAGERQLVALARAAAAEPELLVLDEATSAVDPATEVRIGRAIEALTAGRTTITI
ncbi:MAG: ABC transporter ATP-binding protein/permease, partial [Cellulomonadaceae bacterium]|nr:ABC transporter ATP-binding protein/permease [Cellulomonadaceae bacterium]